MSRVIGTIKLYKMGSEPIAEITITDDPVEQRVGLGEQVNWIVFVPGDPYADEDE